MLDDMVKRNFTFDVTAALSSITLQLNKSVLPVDLGGTLTLAACKRLSISNTPGTGQFAGSKMRQSAEAFRFGILELLKALNWQYMLDGMALGDVEESLAVLAAAFPPGNKSQLTVMDMFVNVSAHNTSWMSRRFEYESDRSKSITGRGISDLGVEGNKRGGIVVAIHPAMSRFVRARACLRARRLARSDSVFLGADGPASGGRAGGAGRAAPAVRRGGRVGARRGAPHRPAGGRLVHQHQRPRGRETREPGVLRQPPGGAHAPGGCAHRRAVVSYGMATPAAAPQPGSSHARAQPAPEDD